MSTSSKKKILVRMDSLTKMHSSPTSSPTPSSSSTQWTLWPPMPTPREGSSAVAVGNHDLYLIGGYHASLKFLNHCSKLDTNTHEWTELPSMHQPRMGCAAVYCKERHEIIVAGGFSKGRAYLNTVEVLDLNTMEWSFAPSMAQSRAGCAAVAVPQGIVVLGGWKDSDTAVDSVELYDYKAKSWSKLPSMNMGRAGSAAVAILSGHHGSSTKVMVMGGHCTTTKHRGCRSSVEVLDLTSQKWTKWPSMRERRDSAAACVVGQCVFVMGGGETSNSPVSSVEVFSLENRQWKRIAPMKSKRFGCTAVAIGNRIVVLGGRGADGKHLETVESLEIPLLDMEEPSIPLSEFLVENHIPTSIKLERNQSSSSMVAAVTKMMEDDKARARGAYERAKRQAKELYERTIKETEERLQALELEKKRLHAQKEAAKKQKDEQFAHADTERREAFAQIEENFRPLLEQARNSSSSDLGHQSLHESGSTHGSTFSAPLPELPENQPSSSKQEEQEPPGELCCCITGCLMEDPVTAMDGHTYEKAAILEWFNQFQPNEPPTSPMTNERLPSRRLIPSHNIRSQCKTWQEKVGEDSLHAPTPPTRRRSSSTGGDIRRSTWTRVGGETPPRRVGSLRVGRSASMVGGPIPFSSTRSQPRSFSDANSLGRQSHPPRGVRMSRRQSIM